MAKVSRVQIGSISHGTMRNEDLIPAFTDELERITGGCPLVEEITAKMEAEDYFESEEAGWDVETLFDALGNYAPAYCYFGAHEGDGADYGYWPSFSTIDEDRRDGELASGDELPETGDSDGALFMQVSDHGNLELYSWDADKKQWHSLWSCV